MYTYIYFLLLSQAHFPSAVWCVWLRSPWQLNVIGWRHGSSHFFLWEIIVNTVTTRMNYCSHLYAETNNMPPVPRIRSVKRYAVIPIAYAWSPSPWNQSLTEYEQIIFPPVLLYCWDSYYSFLNTFNITSLISIWRKFLISACKLWTFHLHQSNTYLLKCTGLHCTLRTMTYI
jgi:hypothetical protein